MTESAPRVGHNDGVPGDSIVTRNVQRLIQALSLLVLIVVVVPFTPSMPGESLDPYRLLGTNPRSVLDAAWIFGLNEAVGQGLTFGEDIAFTLGPYASVYSRSYHPGTANLMMLASLYLAISYWFALKCATRMADVVVAPLALLAILGLCIYPEMLLMSYPILVGLAIRQHVAGHATPVNVTKCAALVAPFGLLPLIKVSTLFLSFGFALLISAWYTVRRSTGLAMTALGVPVVALLGFWFVAGQPVSSLATYLKLAIEVTGGYTEAMSTAGNGWEVVAYLVSSAVVFVAVMWAASEPVDRVFLGVLFALPLTLAAKAGFVRHDGHALIASSTLALIGLLTLVVGNATTGAGGSKFEPLRWFAPVVAVGCSLYIGSQQGQSLRKAPDFAMSRFAQATSGIGHRLTIRDWPNGEFHRAVTALRADHPLPRLSGTSDVYSYRQGELIASRNVWRPRPIFQSYSAYTPYLANKNRDHLASTEAPENVFLQVEPIDSRLPALEDGPSWLVLLDRYRPVEAKDGYLLLKQRGGLVSKHATKAVTVKQALGDVVTVPTDLDGPVFAIFTLEMNPLGKVTNAAYKASPLQIEATLKNGSTRTFRLPSGMANAGFVLSPLVESTQDFGLLFADHTYLAEKRVVSFRVTPDGSSRFWNPEFSVTFRNIPTPPPSNIQTAVQLNALTPLTQTTTVLGTCEVSIDTINGTPFAAETTIKTSSRLLSIKGWMAKSTQTGTLFATRYATLTDVAGLTTLIGVDTVVRPDVAQVFGKAELGNAGFSATVDVGSLKGKYTLGFAFTEFNDVARCAGPRVQLEFGSVPSS